MSYWIYIVNQHNDCTECGRYHEEFEINYTSNVSGIWETALGFPLSFLDGVNVAEALPYLNNALASLRSSELKEDYRRMEPLNGWGTLEGATEIIQKMRDHCEEVCHRKSKRYPSWMVFRINH